MKIVLHGYLHETNFGDILFASLFYEKCKKLDFESVDFFSYKYYKIGEFCRKAIGYTARKSFWNLLKADAFVLISGGSLGEDKPNKAAAKTRFYRFILPARIYQFLGKPVYILGVGGGPIYSDWLKKQTVKMLNKATFITFRDQETKDYFVEYGVTNQMTVTSDTALVITEDSLETFEDKKKLDEFTDGRKKIFLHLSENDSVNEVITRNVVPGLKRFLDNHKEYVVVSSFDNVRVADPEKRLKGLEAIELLKDYDVYLYNYHDAWQLCSLLNEMDTVITHKLHVGIVSSSLGKSVISFPVHQKTQRYYRQIGEAERCMPMEQATPEKVLAQLEKFHDKKIALPEEIRKAAESNLTAMERLH